MTDDVRSGSHPNVIPLHPKRGGNGRVPLTHERLLRIRMRMTELKMDQADLSAATGISNSGISQMFKEKIKATRYFPAIAQALKVNIAWLLGDTDLRVSLDNGKGETISETDLPDLLEQPEFASQRVETIATIDISSPQLDRRGSNVAVPEIDLTQAAIAQFNGISVKQQSYVMGRDLIEQQTRADPASLAVVQGIGDAMQPVLMDSDLIFIDTARRTVDCLDGIWLLRYADMLTVRRVRQTPHGVRLMAENQALPDEVVSAEDLGVLGKVTGILRKF